MFPLLNNGTKTMAFKLELRVNNRLRAMMETKDVYEVVLNGRVFGKISYNMRGYIGYLPMPNGRKLDIGERPITAFKKEVAALNKEAKLANFETGDGMLFNTMDEAKAHVAKVYDVLGKVISLEEVKK